jgi:iron complex transport system substrate-binding protein
VFHRLLATLVAACAVLLLAGPAPSAAPRRIVSLSPTATESLFAIGAGSQVVAVDDQSDYPKNAPRTKLSGFTPNVEAIAAYKPDLVVVSGDSGGVVAGLKKLKIPVLLQLAARNLNEAYAQIERLGAVTGHPGSAKKLVRSMQARIARTLARVPKRQSLSVYHELTPDFFSATSKTFIGRIYKVFGLRNIADAAASTSDYPQLSAEYIVASNPSVIVLADGRCCGQSASTVAARPGWKNIAAVRDRAVVRVDDSVASRWGPRIVDFVRAVGAALRWVGR